MGREARANDTAKWKQLAAAVIELRKHVEAIEQRLDAIAPREQLIGYRKNPGDKLTLIETNES